MRSACSTSVVAEHMSNVFAELETLEACAETPPNRLLLIRLFAPLLEQHPELRSDFLKR